MYPPPTGRSAPEAWQCALLSQPPPRMHAPEAVEPLEALEPLEPLEAVEVSTCALTSQLQRVCREPHSRSVRMQTLLPLQSRCPHVHPPHVHPPHVRTPRACPKA